MKQVNKMILMSGALALSVLFATAQASQSAIQITSEVNELIEVVNEKGESTITVVSADEVTPGDRVLFTTKFQNNGDKSSDNVIITNPIPKHTRYLANSAKGEHCIITFSIDGGRAWGKAQTLKVRQQDGKYRAATAADYTHIRWKYNRTLQPAEKGSISFETKLL